MALADQRSEPSLNERALFLGDSFDIDALDEAVDHDKPQRSPILELLRRHRDANQHIAASGVGLLDRVGGGEDFGDGHPPASDAGGNGGGLGLEFGKAPVDDNVRNGYGEVRSIRRRSETRRTGYGYRPRRTGRRRQRAGRHPRGRNDLPARQARRHRERPSQKQERRPPRSKRLLGEPSRNWRLAGVQEPAPDGLSERKDSRVLFQREIARGERRRQRFCGEMRRLSGGLAPKRKVCGGSGTVNGENLDIFDGGGPIPAAPYLPKSASACVNPFMLTVNFAPAPLTA